MQNSFCNQKFPLYFSGEVVHGYGRGSTQLGYPTANIDTVSLKELKEVPKGVYFGYCRLNEQGEKGDVEPMVMSLGENRMFGNTETTAEVHVLRQYDHNFYGAHLQVSVIGYIRKMQMFRSVDELIEAIGNDIRVARAELEKPELSAFREDPYFK
ncbi:uncharacterized protein LOC126329088 [Schistocerca gregaria]|uniref:uncharacterized protein LOC126329088 n=1 Tax=Schistocerca gregaria TaxID=7010 RepID=UPI00211DE2AF|nr:uncharacterized protein LOC126329088 [Schistocerca gregaria]